MFHAGTKYINGKTYSNGGRVLNIVIRSNNFKSARDKALRLLANLDWKSGFYRKDIAHKVIDQWGLFLENLKEKKLISL